ncbi:hypothetical protein C8R43DRAFT_963011 [Mycena crocata]|nr:hypothetical protein C8R43DRAFT_963011 [Mycena crocata]
MYQFSSWLALRSSLSAFDDFASRTMEFSTSCASEDFFAFECWVTLFEVVFVATTAGVLTAFEEWSSVSLACEEYTCISEPSHSLTLWGRGSMQEIIRGVHLQAIFIPLHQIPKAVLIRRLFNRSLRGVSPSDMDAGMRPGLRTDDIAYWCRLALFSGSSQPDVCLHHLKNDLSVTLCTSSALLLGCPTPDFLRRDNFLSQSVFDEEIQKRGNKKSGSISFHAAVHLDFLTSASCLLHVSTSQRLKASPRGSTLIRPLDIASRRTSRVSHDSAAASTRSWVMMTAQSGPPPAEPIPVPEPVPALAPRPLPELPRRADETGAEHMSVELPTDLGYQWTTGKGSKAREANMHKEGKGFVGGFVSGLRRLPRALVRTRRPRRGTTATEGTEGTEGTGMTGPPQYMSTPPTPVAPDARVPSALRPALAQNVEEGRRRHPSFQIVPPQEDVEQGIAVPVVCDSEHGDGEAMPGGIEFPEAPLENPYDTVSTHGIPPLPAVSPRISRADDRLAVPLDVNGDEPVSVHAHIAPTQDYRRMSAQDVVHPHSGTTITSGSFSTDSPSFSSELPGFHRFLNALHVLPWVATDRITIDYEPKKRTKPLTSWYHPAGESLNSTAQPTPAHGAASPASTIQAPRSPRRHRTHRRATTSTDVPPLPHAAYHPFAYYPAHSPPPQGSNRTSPRPHTTTRNAHTQHAQVHRHHRRSATYHGPTSWVPPPLLPAPPAPVYIVQASSAASASPPASLPPNSNSHPHSSPGQTGSPGSDPGKKRRHGADARANVHADAADAGAGGQPGRVYACKSWLCVRRVSVLVAESVYEFVLSDCDAAAGTDCLGYACMYQYFMDIDLALRGAAYSSTTYHL